MPVVTRNKTMLSRWMIYAQVIAVAMLLCLTFKPESLWTDEAFTAYVACHRTLGSLWRFLQIGNSSDLQMWLYYIYVHTWISVFGDSELGLRSANIPFIVLLAANLAWIRHRLLKSDWVWIGALSPMLWTYSSDARPYLAVMVLSTVFLTCVVTSLIDETLTERRHLPWIGLAALLVGINMDMVTGLIVVPALILAAVYIGLSDGLKGRLDGWWRALLSLSPFYLLSIAFLVWTFLRGAVYDYAPPEFLSILAALFRLVGLGGFTPNRHYDLPFRPYLFGMAVASVLLASGVLVCVLSGWRKRQPLTLGLVAACAGAVIEVLLVTYGMHEQPEARHLAALTPLLSFLLFSRLRLRTSSRRSLLASMFIVAGVWSVSDIRLTFLPEFRREDFRSAVNAVLAETERRPADVAVVADPAAAAYYGLPVEGPPPCFPLTLSCRDALDQVPWTTRGGKGLHVENAVFWTPQHIEQWIKAQQPRRIVLISRSRHPLYLKSTWWSALQTAPAGAPVCLHGFFVYKF